MCKAVQGISQVYFEGTLYPSISLLDKRRDSMTTP
jgi:hypothetical protein